MIDLSVPQEFEYTQCAYCGHGETEPYALLQDWLCGSSGDFAMVRCTKCGLLRQNPRPTRRIIGRYYPEEYKPFADTRIEDVSFTVRIARMSAEYGLRRRVRLVARHQPDGRLLEIGCATGLFLDAAQRLDDWQVQGIEPSAATAEYARQKYGLDVITSSYEDTHLESQSYDIVTMWDVLEHLHEPVAAVQDVARILKPSGVFVIKVPHLESLAARFFGRYWAGLDAPRHLYVFPRPLLEGVLQQAGFEILESQCWGGYHIFALSLQFWLRSRLIDPEHSKLDAFVRSFLQSMPVRVFAFPWFAFVDRVLRRGNTLILVARKR